MKLASLLLASFLFTTLAHPADRHLLYMATPDGAQPGGSGAGVLIFDIDDGHKFVRRIDLPVFKEGIRGFCPNAKTHRAYYTTTNHTLGCLDLETDKIVWEKKYPAGCDRAAVTPDGRKLYVPTGWWLKGEGSGWFVVDAENGEVLKRIPVRSQAHNTVMGLDGQFVYGGSETTLTVIRTSDDTVVKEITPIGESGVFPFTVNSAGTLVYVCLGKTVGFDIADLTTGKVIHRTLTLEPHPDSILGFPASILRRTHGVALTPDEKELWLSDQGGNRLYIFDLTKMVVPSAESLTLRSRPQFVPAPQVGSVDLTTGGHGWITFSLDGRFAWCHTPDVIDTQTRKIVGTFKDENGKPVCSSKFFEAVFRDGKVTAVGDQFGVGRAPLPK